MITLPNIIGQPPTGPDSDQLTFNSLPVMEITPSKPNFELAATLFTLTPDWGNYENLLKKHEFSLDGRPVRLAFIADNFPTDTFTNQYSESFLNRFTDLVSTGAAELTQITGERNAGDTISKLLTAMEGSEFAPLSAVGSGGKQAIAAAGAGFRSVAKAMGKTGQRLTNVANLTKKLLGGYRVDMPMIWKNSGFTPSYTITVRLYNPVPSNPDMKEKYIIGPLAAILLLALPQTEDGVYYNWPFFHQIVCPGLLYVPAAFIGNITVVKGGDQQQITYSQELGVVDVRIEFGSLYDTMIAGNSYESNTRPTLKNYLDNLRDRRGIFIRNVNTGKVDTYETDVQMITDVNLRQNQGDVDVTSEPASRVSATDSTASTTLEETQPDVGFKAWGTEEHPECGVNRFWNGTSFQDIIEGAVYEDPEGNRLVGVKLSICKITLTPEKYVRFPAQ